MMKCVSTCRPAPQLRAARPTIRASVACRASSTDTEAPAKSYQPETDAALLKRAAEDPTVPVQDVFLALRSLQKAKLPAEGWEPIIGGGDYWKLVFNAGKDQVQKNLKDPSAGKGAYFPIYAAQNFELTDAPKGLLKNGVYLGLLAGLQFRGPYEMKGKRLEFDITEVAVKIGPWIFGPFKQEVKPTRGGSPFFIFFYADEDIICAQGKGGGIAYWSKAKLTELAKKAVF